MNAMPLRHCLPSRIHAGGHWLYGILFGLLLALAPALAQQPVPALTGHVIDSTGTLSAAQRQQLEDKLGAFEQNRGAQIVLLLVASTQPEDIFSYSNRVANAWKIGRKEIGDGVLLLVAKDDRKVRIEVAKALEGALPDLALKRVIDEAITPRFKQGDFAGGLDAASDQLMARISGEDLPAPKATANGFSGDFKWTDLAIFLFVAVPVVAGVARRLLGTPLGRNGHRRHFRCDRAAADFESAAGRPGCARGPVVCAGFQRRTGFQRRWRPRLGWWRWIRHRRRRFQFRRWR